MSLRDISRHLTQIKRLANDDQVDDETIADEIEEVKDMIQALPSQKDREAAERLFNKTIK